MTIKGVFFDAADVLYCRSKSTSMYVADLLRERGFSTELSAQDQMRHKVLRSEATAGRLSHDEYWHQYLLMHGVVDDEERRILAGKIDDHSDRILPIQGGREMLASLKQRGFALAIITDTIYPLERKMQWLEQVGITEFVDAVTCSSVLGVHKPDPAIYLLAVQQVGLQPGESVFVGHDANELKGARQSGMVTIAVNHDPDAQADYYAGSLLDLLQVPILQNHTLER
jgi:HAD superfamily hydrolase (TIGR01509 family)